MRLLWEGRRYFTATIQTRIPVAGLLKRVLSILSPGSVSAKACLRCFYQACLTSGHA
jgi:hypothetical protein